MHFSILNPDNGNVWKVYPDGLFFTNNQLFVDMGGFDLSRTYTVREVLGGKIVYQGNDPNRAQKLSDTHHVQTRTLYAQPSIVPHTFSVYWDSEEALPSALCVSKSDPDTSDRCLVIVGFYGKIPDLKGISEVEELQKRSDTQLICQGYEVGTIGLVAIIPKGDRLITLFKHSSQLVVNVVEWDGNEVSSRSYPLVQWQYLAKKELKQM